MKKLPMKLDAVLAERVNRFFCEAASRNRITIWELQRRRRAGTPIDESFDDNLAELALTIERDYRYFLTPIGVEVCHRGSVGDRGRRIGDRMMVDLVGIATPDGQLVFNDPAGDDVRLSITSCASIDHDGQVTTHLNIS